MSAETVINCFIKAGFFDIINGIQSQIQVDVKDYINLDNDVVVSYEDMESISTEMLIISTETLAILSEDELESAVEDKLISYIGKLI